MRENLLIDKSLVFAARIVKLYQYLTKSKKETIISKQLIRSGTSIGANINEANYATINIAKSSKQKTYAAFSGRPFYSFHPQILMNVIKYPYKYLIIL